MQRSVAREIATVQVTVSLRRERREREGGKERRERRERREREGGRGIREGSSWTKHNIKVRKTSKDKGGQKNPIKTL